MRRVSMIKRLLIMLVAGVAGLNLMAGEVEESLLTVDAPGGEFVRMPARYIF